MYTCITVHDNGVTMFQKLVKDRNILSQVLGRKFDI